MEIFTAASDAEVEEMIGQAHERRVVADIIPGAPLYHEEVLGPDSPLHRASGIEGALRIANATNHICESAATGRRR
ncbi:hypothetical protein ACFWWB_19005 [Streptomyces sp. NPDC058690]|uniref:hypothetical protein n=1 Tax=Streptomyces sp. NPDC058690 TaxID=3346600 RepID=UPI00364DC261